MLSKTDKSLYITKLLDNIHKSFESYREELQKRISGQKLDIVQTDSTETVETRPTTHIERRINESGIEFVAVVNNNNEYLFYPE